MAAAPAGQHAHWSSRFAFILAAVGSAVGLGNLWRFPFMTGQNGGSAFVLIYIGCVILFALPVLMAEIAIGRHAQQSAISSTRKMAQEAGRSANWSIVGWVCTAGGFLIVTTYSVIAGRVMAYSAAGFAGGFSEPDGAGMFYNGEGVRLLWHAGFMLLTVLIVARGLKGGIERVATLLMPLFFVMLIALTIYSLLFSGAAGEAIAYMFNPDFSAVTGQTVIDALGQAFFSVSVASAIMITYGSYLSKDTNIGSSSIIIASADTMVALVAGLMIFPIVFMVGMDPADGDALIFSAFPAVFADMPGGNFIGGAFFALAFIAAITSSISLLEGTVAFIEEHSTFSRATAATLLGTFAFLVGAGAVYSSAYDGDFIGGFIGVLLPLGGLLVAVFAGWVIPRSLMREEMSHASNGLFAFFHFCVKFIVPPAIGFILLLGLDAKFNSGNIGSLLGLG